MKPRILAALMAASIAVSGCRAAAYQAFASQNLSNLRRLRPRFEKGLRALEREGRDPELTEIDLGLIDDMIEEHEAILEAQGDG